MSSNAALLIPPAEPPPDRRPSAGPEHLRALPPDAGPDQDPTSELYRYAARRGAVHSLADAAAELGRPVAALSEAATRLVELRLLRVDAGGRLLPVDRSVALSELVTPIERAMYSGRELVDRLRGQVEQVAGPGPTTIDRLEGPDEIRGLLATAAQLCRQEVLVLRPARTREDELDGLLEACFAALGPQVAVRMIYPHRSRADFASRARVRRLLERGAQIRTRTQVPQAAVVLDRRLAVVLEVPDGEGPPTARRIEDQDLARFVVDLFDQLWEDADGFESARPGYAGAGTSLQQSIVRLMAQGLTDDAVARRLGMSVRTCRRHIATLLDTLDSVSRFQAGVQAAQRFAVDVPGA